jgi:hypothetical protein
MPRAKPDAFARAAHFQGSFSQPSGLAGAMAPMLASHPRRVAQPTGAATMHGKFFFGGDGAKIPGTDFGLSFSLFKLWLRPTGLGFKGYTTASNQGLLGVAIVESLVVEFVLPDLSDEEPFFELHGATVDVTITSNLFVKDGGIATLRILRRTNDGMPRQLTFMSDECKGVSFTAGDIHFVATLVALPSDEQDPTGLVFVDI